MEESKQGEKHLLVKLGPEAVKALDAISDGGTRPYEDLIRDAIWLAESASLLLAKGGKIYLQSPSGEIQEISMKVLKDMKDDEDASGRDSS